MKYKELFSSKFSVIILIITLAFLANLKYRQYIGQADVEKLKQDLRNQAKAQQQKNNDLANSIAYLNSESFKEQAAREQLNLKKEGEIVYSFSDPNEEIVTENTQPSKITNPQKWWNYFFNQNP